MTTTGESDMIFGVIVAVQKYEIDQYCMKCDHMLVGMLLDKELGTCLPCHAEHCSHEETRMFWGECTGAHAGEEVVLRKLKPTETEVYNDDKASISEI